MKRLLSMIIALTLIGSAMTASAVNKEDYNENKWDFLAAIGATEALDAEGMGSETLTRGEYVTHLMTLLRHDEAYESQNLFDDVDESDNCYDAANIAKLMGLYDSVIFRPDEDIYYRDAVEMLVKAMGYSPRLKVESLLSVANSLRLPSISMTKEMTCNDMVELFYEAVHAPLLKYDISFGERVQYTLDDNKTILSQYYRIEMIEGIVTHNGRTSLYAADRLVYGGMAINEKEYGDSRKLTDAFLGYNVRAYIDYSQNEEDGNLVYIQEKKNNVLTLQDDEIDQTNERVTSITYTKADQNRSITKKIDKNARVIYNGKFIADYSRADFMPSNGSVTLIDHDDDGVFEVAVIWSYETIFIERVSQSNKVIYNAYTYKGALTSLSLDTDLYDSQYEIFWDGDQIAFSQLQKNQVISVAKSKNEQNGYIRIELSKEQVVGKVEGIDRSEGELQLNGVIYGVVPEFFEEYTNIVYGDNYIFFIDAFGKIAGMVRDSGSEYTFAYLYSAQYDDVEEAAVIKVFTEKSDWVRYTIADKIRYNGKSVKPRELIEGKDGKVLPLAHDGVTERQLVKLKYDGTSLREIVTSSETAPVGEFNKSTQSLNYYNQNTSFSSLFYLYEKTVVFGIPSDAPTNLDAYVVAPSLSWDKLYNITAYEYDEYGYTRAFVLPVTVSTLGKTIKNVLVLDVVQIVNSDDMPVSVLRCSFGMFEQFDIEISKNVSLPALNKGDIITLTTDETGKIKSVTTLYTRGSEGEKLSTPANLHTDGNLFGKVVKNDPDNSRIIMNFGADRTKQPLKTDYAEIVVKTYNVKKNKCDLTSVFDLEPDDYLVMYSAGSNIEEIIKYDIE